MVDLNLPFLSSSYIYYLSHVCRERDIPITKMKTNFGGWACFRWSPKSSTQRGKCFPPVQPPICHSQPQGGCLKSPCNWWSSEVMMRQYLIDSKTHWALLKWKEEGEVEEGWGTDSLTQLYHPDSSTLSIIQLELLIRLISCINTAVPFTEAWVSFRLSQNSRDADKKSVRKRLTPCPENLQMMKKTLKI